MLHDQLEAETVKCSILRHELKFLPDQYRQEIHGIVSTFFPGCCYYKYIITLLDSLYSRDFVHTDAVINARQSNSDLVENLNAQLVNIDQSIEELTARQEKLDADNTKQLPERDRLRVQHEDVITVLNQRMAEKATRQIKLNETRDKLRATNSRVSLSPQTVLLLLLLLLLHSSTLA